MKSISIREFQLHAEQYLKELPITLTRYNMPVAVVSPIGVNALSEDELMVKANRGAKTFEKELKKMEVFKNLKEQIETPREESGFGYFDNTPPSDELTYSNEDL